MVVFETWSRRNGLSLRFGVRWEGMKDALKDIAERARKGGDDWINPYLALRSNGEGLEQ